MQSTLAASPSTSSPTSSVSYSSSTASPYHDHAFSTISTLPTAQHSQPRREDRGQGSGVAGQLYECNVPLHGLPSPLLDSYLAHGHSHGLGLGRGNDSFSAGSSLSYPLPNTRYFPGHDNGEQHHRGHRGLGEPSIGAGPSVDPTMGLVANSPGVTSMSTGLGYARTVSAPISSSRSTTSCTLLGGVDVHPTYFSPTGVMISGHATPPNSASNTTATGHGTLSRVQWDVYSQSHHAEELTDYSHGWDWIGTGPVPIPLPAPTATVTSSHLRETGAFVSTSSSTAPSSSVDYEGIKPALATTSVPVNVRNLNIQTTSKDHLYPNPHPQRPQHIPLTDSNPLLLSPTAQLPTPAAMAVLLNQSNRTDGSGYPSSTGASLPPHGPGGPLVQNGGAPIGRSARGVPLSNSSATSAGTNGANPLTTTPGSHPMSNTNNTSNGRGDNQSREKKHACTMCHKRFDRPSTLRKHLLVHTGEKAFVCDTCGRRFGVASNLNRHVRRCILKPVNTSLVKPNGTNTSPTASLASSAVTHSAAITTTNIVTNSTLAAVHNDVSIAIITETIADCATGGGLNADHDHDFEYQHKPTSSSTIALLANNAHIATTGEDVMRTVVDFPKVGKKNNAKVEERSPKLRQSPTDSGSSTCSSKSGSKNIGGGIITAKMSTMTATPMTTTTDVHTTMTNRSKPAQKRRRRAPSPSQWIPPSLLAFNLTSEDFFKAVPIPLPPVRRDPPKEERDSWDENFGTMPYHPREWRGVLPGPGLGIGLGGLGARDLRNLDLGGSSGCVLGRVAVC